MKGYTVIFLFCRNFSIIGSSFQKENERVKIVRKNVLPYLQTQLALRSIDSISDLVWF